MHDMGNSAPTESPPQLLVSVRNASEALVALAGGCDLLDVKEPARGSLGMADPAVIREVSRTATSFSRRVPLSAALGETRAWFGRSDVPPLPDDLRYVKLGTAGLADVADWRSRWTAVRRRFDETAGRPFDWIAVAYADWQRAAAPPPGDVIAAALATNCAGVLFDTFHKDGQTLFDCLSRESLRNTIVDLRARGLLVAVAGGLSEREVPIAALLQPDVVAVRTAACAGGRRDGPVTASAVGRLRELLGYRRIEAGGVLSG